MNAEIGTVQSSINIRRKQAQKYVLDIMKISLELTLKLALL